MIKKYVLLMLLVLFAGNLNAEVQTYKMVFVPASEKGDESDYKTLISITEKLTGFNIETIKVTDYNAAVEAMRAGRAHIAWYGGKTYVKAAEIAQAEAFAAGVRNAAYTSVNELENMQDGWKEVVDANGNVSNSEYDSIYNIPDRTDPNYDHDRIPLFDVIRGHTIRANEVGTYVEKIVPYDITDNKMMRLDSSFSVNRWSNSSPMSDYSDKTIDDLINNSNSLYNSNPKQMGCKVNINTRDAAIDVADDIGVPDYIGEFITLDCGENSSPVTYNVNLYHTWINNMQQVSNIPTENNI